jgi:hypothetical protein
VAPADSGGSAPFLDNLRRLLESRPAARAGERCEMCGEPIPDQHPHLVRMDSRSLLCVCRPCFLLFTSAGAAGGKYKPVPERCLFARGLVLAAEQWERLQIPVNIAFFFFNSGLGRNVAFYPSPAGATESLLPLESWAELVEANPLLRSLEPDVEALLVYKRETGFECYIAPIDVCYELVGRIRKHWKGFHGGAEAWQEIDAFFAVLRARSVEPPAPAEDGGTRAAAAELASAEPTAAAAEPASAEPGAVSAERVPPENGETGATAPGRRRPEAAVPSFALAQKVADAVLYEGYVLYPYRASSAKNRVRFQFGVVAPRGYAEAGSSETWATQTECLIEPGAAPLLDLKIRFLQLQARGVEEAVEETPAAPRPPASLDSGEGSEAGEERPSFRPVEFLDLEGEREGEGERLVAWDEGVERELEVTGIALRDLLAAEKVIPLDAAAGHEIEELRSPAGALRGRLVRERWAISAVVRVAAEEAGGWLRLRVRVENQTPWPDGAPTERDLALRRSLLGAHTLLAVRGGAFVSLLDPPAAAAAAAAACANQHTWPVLIGPEGSREVMLSSPIILYDYPAVAPESPGDLCDSTEIDEILTLRIMTLTDEEKREARGTDPRARRIVARADEMPPEIFERLHGAMRSLAAVAPDAPARATQTDAAPFSLTASPALDQATPAGETPAPEPFAPVTRATRASAAALLSPELASWESFLNPPGMPPPEEATVEVGGVRLGKGSRVRLQPSRRADSMDFFLAGRSARVAAVHRDVDDEVYLAVTLDDDPAGDLHGWIGRYFYFYPDEVEPLADPGPPVEALPNAERRERT